MSGSKENIALITYHSAYNYGSALQAFATLRTLRNMDYNVEIINYRLKEQRYFYEKILRFRNGIRSLVNDFTLLRTYGDRQKRNASFETFFKDHYTMSRELEEPEDVYSMWSAYDTIVSGSDQIWNKASCELRNNDWKYMDPYLLKGFPGKKISYASSVNTMSEDDLQRILPSLSAFDALAFREEISGRKIAKMLNREVEHVLDPTFLLTKDEWKKELCLEEGTESGRYIFCYLLAGIRPVRKLLEEVIKLARKRNCKAIVVTPYVYVPVSDPIIEYHHEYGPTEFMQALSNAEMVITNSYHGTVLSVNFGKEFYSIGKQGGADVRKTDILEHLGLASRVVTDLEGIAELVPEPIDYDAVYKKLDRMRHSSLAYLRGALSAEKK